MPPLYAMPYEAYTRVMGIADCFVYLIADQNRRVFKIGMSTNIRGRVKRLQRYASEPLEVLWLTPGGRELETALHKRFKERRLTNEWFDFSGIDDPATLVAPYRNQADPRRDGRR